MCHVRIQCTVRDDTTVVSAWFSDKRGAAWQQILCERDFSRARTGKWRRQTVQRGAAKYDANAFVETTRNAEVRRDVNVEQKRIGLLQYAQCGVH